MNSLLPHSEKIYQLLREEDTRLVKKDDFSADISPGWLDCSWNNGDYRSDKKRDSFYKKKNDVL